MSIRHRYRDWKAGENKHTTWLFSSPFAQGFGGHSSARIAFSGGLPPEARKGERWRRGRDWPRALTRPPPVSPAFIESKAGSSDEQGFSTQSPSPLKKPATRAGRFNGGGRRCGLSGLPLKFPVNRESTGKFLPFAQLPSDFSPELCTYCLMKQISKQRTGFGRSGKSKPANSEQNVAFAAQTSGAQRLEPSRPPQAQSVPTRERPVSSGKLNT